MAAYQYVYVMKGLGKTYSGGREVLKDIWLSFLPGAKIGVLGVNGAGKSTLLRIMAGEDRDFTGEAWPAEGARVVPLFAASLAAATAAGDLRPSPLAAANQFWFAHHIVATIAFGFLPGRACVPYEGGLDRLVEQASWFILRGLGMADAAIAAALAERRENLCASEL